MPGTTIVVHVRAKPGHGDFVEAQLLQLISPSRGEAGCFRYDMFSDLEDPLHFIFLEEWRSVDDYRLHMDEPHMVAFIMACKGKLAEASTYNLQSH